VRGGLDGRDSRPGRRRGVCFNPRAGPLSSGSNAARRAPADTKKWLSHGLEMLLAILEVSRQPVSGRVLADGFVVVDVGRVGVE
jgi:hypothetical protein